MQTEKTKDQTDPLLLSPASCFCFAGWPVVVDCFVGCWPANGWQGNRGATTRMAQGPPGPTTVLPKDILICVQSNNTVNERAPQKGAGRAQCGSQRPPALLSIYWWITFSPELTLYLTAVNLNTKQWQKCLDKCLHLQLRFIQLLSCMGHLSIMSLWCLLTSPMSTVSASPTSTVRLHKSTALFHIFLETNKHQNPTRLRDPIESVQTLEKS